MTKSKMFYVLGCALLVSSNSVVFAKTNSSLKIELNSESKISSQKIIYNCVSDGSAGADQLLSSDISKVLEVNYINAGAVSLAVLPVRKNTQVFSEVMAASGAKYAAADYVWWTKDNEAGFSNVMNDSSVVNCTVKKK